MAANEYRFVTRWRVRGTPEEVYEVLNNPTDLVHWWPAVYLDVTDVTAEGEESVYAMDTTGLFPYTLHWRLHPVERTPHERIELEARGDLVGRGVWTIAESPASADPWVDITYEWTVRADKPLLRWFSVLLRPVFALNHRWAMATGEKSLRRELARRRAPTEDARARFPAPPEPTPTSSRPLMVGLVLVAFVICGITRLRSAN
jgi:uncharacterized protein YndB with AHSA1/START domain